MSDIIKLLFHIDKMLLKGRFCNLIKIALTILVCNCAAHDDNVPHNHPIRNPHPHAPGQPQHSHAGVNNQGHSHGPPRVSHSHAPGSNTHSHGPNADHSHSVQIKRTRFAIANLWNGSLDTVSQAQNKGGNQVVLTLEGTNPK